jgi:hypothetical protein
MAYRVSYICAKYNIPKELVYVLDQYGQKLLPVSDRTRVPVNSKSVPVLGSNDKRQITGVPVETMAGVFVGHQLIWQGTTDRCHPKKSDSHPKIYNTHSENHWSTPATMRHLVQKIIVPHKTAVIASMGLNAVQTSEQKSLLILDVWKHHLSREFKELLDSQKIEATYIDPGCTSKSQVGDLVVNRKMKSGPTEVICEDIAKKVAAQLKARALLQEQGVTPSAIQIDVKMAALKPMVVKGIIKSINFFESVEGKALILKGFKMAGLSKIFDLQFIQSANTFITNGTTVAEADRINPDLPPANDLPPNAGDEDVLAFVRDEEFMDLVESNSDDDSF